jgi:hypothetical protein
MLYDVVKDHSKKEEEERKTHKLTLGLVAPYS